MEAYYAGKAKQHAKWAETEQALISGGDHPLIKMPKVVEKLELNDETFVSQAILEYVANNFPNLKELEIQIEHDDDAPRLCFQELSFPKLERLELNCVGLDSINFQKDKYPSLKIISMENIVGELAGFRLDLPTLQTFSCQFVTLDNCTDFAASLSRCTNLEYFAGYKLWGLSCPRSCHKLYLPNCEEFDVYRSDDVSYLDIYAPKLQKLNLQACYSLDHIRLVDEPFGRPVCCFNCNKQEGAKDGAIEIALKQCATCKIAQYCSEECQKKHWDEHKAYCGKKILVNVLNANIGKESMKHLRKHPRVMKVFKSEDDAMAFMMA